MPSALFGPDGRHFGWLYEGDVFDPGFHLLAFREVDDLFSAKDLRWLGPCERGGVYDRCGGIVALVLGQPVMRVLAPRIRPISPRLKPARQALPEELRDGAILPSHLGVQKRWTGPTVTEWLGQ